VPTNSHLFADASKSVVVPVCRHGSRSASGGDETDHSDGDEVGKPSLKPVKPGQAVRARKEAKAASLAGEQGRRPQSADEEGIDRHIVSAVDKVAKSFPDKDQQKKTRSDLLQKLQEHSDMAESPKATTDISSLFAGMRVDKRPTAGTSHGTSDRRSQLAGGSGDTDSGRTRQPRSVTETLMSSSAGHRKGPIDTRKLFEGPALGIFSTKSDAKADGEVELWSLFDKLEHEESVKLMSMPPNNAFEEMIRWTKEGKLWKFPIDNEQDLDEEVKVGFHEHVFVEQYIDDRFPARGPIRHFMELVAVGLSKNPYFTATEKREHISWYAEYFKDKYHLIEDLQTTASEQTVPGNAN
jgi:small subunit ribosomal protein S31